MSEKWVPASYEFQDPMTDPAPDERQAGLRTALREALPAAVNFRFLPPRPVEDGIWDEIAGELAAALPAQVPAQEERATPEGWEWQCAGCHRPVAPMGMCETCGVFGIMRAAEHQQEMGRDCNHWSDEAVTVDGHRRCGACGVSLGVESKEEAAG